MITKFTTYINESLFTQEYLFNKSLKNILNSKQAYSLLDGSNAGEVTWMEGGCHILADALNLYLDDSQIYVIHNIHHDRYEHFVIKYNNKYIDSDGIQDKSEMLNKMKELELVYDELDIVKYEESMDTHTIPKDLSASKKLAELFKKRNLPKY